MKKLFLIGALALLLFSHNANSTPQSGLWWNPAEDGRGYGIDVQGDTIVVTTFAYGNNGKMQWYISSGKLTSNGTRFSGALVKTDNGQCLTCAWTGSPMIVGDDGMISLTFHTRTTATLTLPSGRISSIQRQNFGIGSPPAALLGEWTYVYTISTSFAEKYRYTLVGQATPNGSGVVVDVERFGGAEFQRSGSLAGKVLAIRTDANATRILDQYLFDLQLEEGRGDWINPTTNAAFAMRAYKTATATGLVKMAQQEDAHALAAESLRAQAVLKQNESIGLKAQATLTPQLLAEAAPAFDQMLMTVRSELAKLKTAAPAKSN